MREGATALGIGNEARGYRSSAIGYSNRIGSDSGIERKIYENIRYRR
jgi:hypothetical protein